MWIGSDACGCGGGGGVLVRSPVPLASTHLSGRCCRVGPLLSLQWSHRRSKPVEAEAVRQDLCRWLLARTTLLPDTRIHRSSSSPQLFVFDLNSAAKTHKNGNVLPTLTHVQLLPGDVLRFGQATRCVPG